MKKIYAFEHKSDFEKYHDIIDRFTSGLSEYQQILEEEFSLKDKPKAVVWTTEELATTVFSEVPIPAYTNKDLIYMSPEIKAWENIFEDQLNGKDLPGVRRFYKENTEKEMLIILAHELTHHSDLFLDDFDEELDEGIWFEEGMCLYLPRKLLLNKSDFNQVTNVETELYNAFKDEYGNHSLEAFGSSSYQGTLSSIMFDYWRSYLTVKYLVEVRADNDIAAVFDDYHKWGREGRKVTLSKYFDLEN